MIKRQYNRWRYGSNKSYFDNFVDAHGPDEVIEEKLLLYKANIGKSKNKNHKLNVKWHDSKMYVMFVLRWS